MRSENTAALRFILQDDIYLLQSDKAAVSQAPETPVETISPTVVIPTATTTATLPEPPAATPQITVTETPAVQFNYMGGNKKRFLIITHYPTEEFIAADHLAALQNILKRKDYDMDDVAILNIATSAVTAVTDLVNYFKPEKLLILGEAAVPGGMGVPPLNQPKKMKNGVLLHSFSFDEMMSSTDNKKAFWEQMKNL
ncbi:hypothetical protein [Mucilaginibacter sp. UYCu711]|uniref:hypothetical protein n=1 Tax=Mucilaginibacter sp. UYCu711 TaxID=3156339 RepID=UPI003D219E01